MTVSRKPAFRTLYRLLCANFLITIVICYFYILIKGAQQNWMSLFFVHFAMISNALILYALSGLCFAVLILAFLNRAMWAVLIILCALHALFIVDITIYRIFHFHINSMVINLIFTKGVGDVIHLGKGTVITFFLLLAGLFFMEVLLFQFFKKKEEKPLPRTAVIVAVVLSFFIIMTDKIVYAVSDLYNIREITRLTKLFPLYQPLTVKRFARRHFGIEPVTDDMIRADLSSSDLRYPKEKLAHKTPDVYPDILWMISDGWRFDMLNPEITPHIYEFSKTCTVFNNHYSGGNATRFGIFSLFYGLYGYYWHSFLEENQSPVFIDALIEAGYDIKIIASASCSNPEFRKTAFVKIPETITDNLNGETVAEKDMLATQTFFEWIETRDPSRPFFSFIFYDAPHGPYSYPDEFDISRPSNRNPNYLTIGKKDAGILKNSYMNAIRFNDHEIGEILSYLHKSGKLENTIVLITGDHGEEFHESGFLGHNSAFSPYQTKVPLILYDPEQKPEIIRCMTSHVDVVPTFMQRIGYAAPVSAYSQGRSLFDGRGHDHVVSASWGECAIIDMDHYFCFSLETHNIGFFEIRDQRYKLIDDYKSIFRTKKNMVAAVLDGMKDFKKQGR